MSNKMKTVEVALNELIKSHAKEINDENLKDCKWYIENRQHELDIAIKMKEVLNGLVRII